MGLIKEGQKAKIFLNKAGCSKKEFDCLVNAVDKESLSLESHSALFNSANGLEEGAEVSVHIITLLGIKIFDSIILSAPDYSDLVIEYVEDSEIVQRREYLRVEFYAKMVIEKDGCKSIVAQSIDISGGGIKFFSDSLFVQGETISATIYLPSPMLSVKLNGIILKHDHFSPKQYVLKYTEISEKDRDKIIKLCFEVQRNSLTA